MRGYTPLTSEDEARFSDQQIDTTPFTERIVIGRRAPQKPRPPGQRGDVATNVPHIVVSHSPDGYEFGYGGSGPSDLALNIVENALRESGLLGELNIKPYKTNCYRGQAHMAAYLLHQDFKWDFIAGLDNLDYVTGNDATPSLTDHQIPYDDVIAWLRERLPGIAGRLYPETVEDWAAEEGISLADLEDAESEATNTKPPTPKTIPNNKR